MTLTLKEYPDINQNISFKIVFLLVGLFIAYFAFLSFARHDNFYSLRLDLGNMDQTVWNVLHGNGFTLTDPMGIAQHSRLAVHADFLLIFMAPLYIIWSSPKMLLLVQSIVVGLGGFVIYAFAHERLRSNKGGLLFGFMYLLYPPLQELTLHDFHSVALSTTFLLLAFWYIRKNNMLLFIVYSVLAGLGKEQVWITIGFLGVYAIYRKHYFVGTFIALLGFIAFGLLFWVFIPRVSPDNQHWALTYLSGYGGNINEIIKGMITQPFQLISQFFAFDRLYYYFQLLSPVGFLSLLSPLALIFSLPDLLINILSNNQLLRQIDYQYTSTITPWIFISAIYGYEKLQAFFRGKKIYGKSITTLLPYILLICTIGSSYVWGELPFERKSNFFYFTSSLPENTLLRFLEKDIDSRFSISATNNVAAHFSQRQFLYNFPLNAEHSDYVIAKLGDRFAWPSGEAQFAAVTKLLHSPSYKLIEQVGSVYVFRKEIL